MWRNYKWVWVPIVFILLGVMQPITSYYLPQLLDVAGGLPEGAVIDIPLPSPEMVMVEAINNMGMMGLLVLVLSSMGVVSGERGSGVAGMVLVKPVKFISYITAKWAGVVTLTLLSLGLGVLAGWYYTELLIGAVDVSSMAASYAITALWFIFVMTLTVFFSSIMRSGGAVAFLALLCAVSLTLITSLIPKWMQWSPGNLLSNAANVLMGQPVMELLWLHIAVSGVMIAVLLCGAAALFKRKELIG